MARYHLRFQSIHPRTLAATKDLLDSNPWQADDETKWREFTRWIDRVSKVYSLPVPTFEYNPAYRPWGGCYTPEAGGHIALGNWSVVTLLHEFRHHMQNQELLIEDMTYDQAEDDARAWSCSLFYKLRPRQFRRMVRAGRIMYVRPDELLRTDRTEISEDTG